MAPTPPDVVPFASMLRARQALLTITLVIGCLAPSLLGAQSGFSAAERRAIASGELVERPTPERRNYLGGASYRVLDRPIAEVWRGLHDVGNYRHMLPNTSESTVVETRGATSVLRIGHHYGLVSASYHLRLTYDDDAHHLDFALDESRPNDIASARGFCEVQSYDGDANRTLITWAARVDPGSSVLLDPIRPEIQRWVLRVPSTMRTYLVDGSGRDRYRD